MSENRTKIIHHFGERAASEFVRPPGVSVHCIRAFAIHLSFEAGVNVSGVSLLLLLLFYVCLFFFFSYSKWSFKCSGVAFRFVDEHDQLVSFCCCAVCLFNSRRRWCDDLLALMALQPWICGVAALLSIASKLFANRSADVVVFFCRPVGRAHIHKHMKRKQERKWFMMSKLTLQLSECI